MIEDSYILDAESGVIVDDNIYLFCRSLNMLYKFDIKRNAVEYVSSIPNRYIITQRLVGKMLFWRDTIILLPAINNAIWLYNINTYKWKEIVLENIPVGRLISFQGLIYEDNLCVIGSEYGYIIHVDLLKETIEYDDAIYVELSKGNHTQFSLKEDAYFRSASIITDECIILGCRADNKVVNYNYRNRQYSINEISYCSSGVEGVLNLNRGVLYADRLNSNMFLCGDSECINIEPPVGSGFKFLSAVDIGQSIYFLSKFTGNSFFYNESGKIIDNRSFIFWEKHGNDFLCMDSNNRLYFGKTDKLLQNGIELKMPYSEMREIINNKNDKKDILVREDTNNGLRLFLECI